MSFEQIVFYAFSAIMLVSALMVVSVRNPVYAALFLVLAFFNAAGVWMLAEAEFLAIVLVLVYVGAVMVLFLFVVMMLDINVSPLQEGFIRYFPVGAGIAAIMVAELLFVLLGGNFFGLENYQAPVPKPADYSNTEELGNVLYTVYLYPFEIAAVILLVAIVAAIVLTMRRRPQTRFQDPAKQVIVRKEDRLRVLKMPSESKEERS